MKKSLFLAFTVSAASAGTISAAMNTLPAFNLDGARCFQFSIDLPDRAEIEPDKDLATGCYLKVTPEQEMAFVKDEDGANLLTTALLSTIGERKSLKHFSMSAGEIVMVEQKEYTINPLPIPPSIEEALKSEFNRGEILNAFQESAPLKRLREIYQKYQKPASKVVAFDASEKSTRNEQAYLPEEKQPTDGYWWPHIGLPLARDEFSPLSKYDAYVKSVSGYNPNTVGWEKSFHNSSVDWAGHCNGWVSSSILYGYDDFSLKDEANNTIITSSDIQGLRSVQSYCTRNAFYGRRYYGPRSDINDIYPQEFHRLLRYYIRDLGKPIAYDFRTKAPVDNHIISGYKTEFYETDTPNKWLVKTDLRSHAYSYDDFVTEKRIAPIYTRTYWYYLWESATGRFYRGEWVNPEQHPDFIWVPLSESRCGRENPRLRTNWLQHMFENLERI